MAKSIRKFVNREFVRTVDLDLLRRLMLPYSEAIDFRWEALPLSETKKREAIFEYFKNTDTRFPKKLFEALHKILVLSNENGARLLTELAEHAGVTIIPLAEREGKVITSRHLALRAYLEHRAVFDVALNRFAFWSVRSPTEFSGSKEGVESRHADPIAKAAFCDAAVSYFSERYRGDFCEVHWYPEEEEICILVLHGKHAVTANVVEKGSEDTLQFQEIAQDTIRYHAASGRVWISAAAAAERKTLADLFAEHMLGDKDFFKGANADRIYTLAPIQEQGINFCFKKGGHSETESILVKEIQIDEGEHEVDGKIRYSPWAMTVRDSQNAIMRLYELAPDVDLRDLRINHVKLEFRFRNDDREDKVLVKVKPKNTASFRNHAYEKQILEHLERNGIRHPAQSGSSGSAPE